MDYLDDVDKEFGVSATPAVSVASVALSWPIYAALAISVAGIGIAIFQSPSMSGVAYLVLMLLGCGLLFYRRYEAIAATRRAGGAGTLGVQTMEKAAIAALALACLANGIVIAFEVAGWQVWTDLRESLG